MRLLIDTHAFLWLLREPERLSDRALDACTDPENELYLSVVSLWEMQIKISLGKLQVRASLRRILEDPRVASQLQILIFDTPHLWPLEHMARHHKDPFDRALIAQAQAEEMVVITGDMQFQKYPVATLW